MPSARQSRPLTRRAATLLRLLTACTMLGLTSCDDPKKAAAIRWREEEVAAKETDLVKREHALLEQRQAAETLEAQIKQQQALLAAREKVLADTEEKV